MADTDAIKRPAPPELYFPYPGLLGVRQGDQPRRRLVLLRALRDLLAGQRR